MSIDAKKNNNEINGKLFKELFFAKFIQIY